METHKTLQSIIAEYSEYGTSIKTDHILDHKIILNKLYNTGAMQSIFSTPNAVKAELNNKRYIISQNISKVSNMLLNIPGFKKEITTIV